MGVEHSEVLHTQKEYIDDKGVKHDGYQFLYGFFRNFKAGEGFKYSTEDDQKGRAGGKGCNQKNEEP